MLDSLKAQEPKRLDYAPENQLNQKRQVKLKTCADVYEHWRSYKRSYKKAPRDGVEFQIDYIDTGLGLSEEERTRAPIALALHGAPGSYHDFSLLINQLSKQKVRVIAPNFPEYIATVKTKVLFRHSADEKAAYLRDFLKAINVKTIDLLISHSSAIFPTLLILLNANNEAIARQRQQRAKDDCPTTTTTTTTTRRSEKDQVAESKESKSKRDKKAKGREPDVRQRQHQQQVAVESFSAIGNQLRGGVVQMVAAGEEANSSQMKKEECADGERGNHNQDDEDNDNDEEAYEDATDELDNNNNNNNNRRMEGRVAKELSDLSGAGGDNLGKQESRIRVAATEELLKQEDECQDDELVSSSSVEQANEEENALNGFTLKRRRQQKQDNKKEQKESKSSKKPKRRLFGQDVIVQFDEPIEIKAVALLNPAGHRMPQSMKPCWFKCGSVHVYQHKLGRSIFRKFGPAFLTVVGVPVRVDNMDNVMLSATVMRNSKCQRVVRQLEQLSQMKIPTLLVFSENDKLIEKEIFYEMTQFMRLDTKSFDVFNNDGDIELSQSLMEDWIRVMVFKAGGHYAYSNYAKTVNRAVSELLARVSKSSDTTANSADKPQGRAEEVAATTN